MAKKSKINLKKILVELGKETLILAILIFLGWFLYLTFKQILKKFFEDIGANPWLLIAIFSIVFICLWYARYLSSFWAKDDKDIILSKVKRINNWFLFTIAGLFMFIALIFMLYNSLANYALPINVVIPVANGSQSIISNSTTGGVSVSCESLPGREREFMLEKGVYCQFSTNYTKNSNYSLKRVEMISFLKNNSQIIENYYAFNTNFTASVSVPLKINLDFNQALMNIYFQSADGEVLTHNFWIIPKNILTQDQYFQKRTNSITILIALFSILIISFVIAMNNLRQIWKNK
jgi:hypothetical protein